MQQLELDFYGVRGSVDCGDAQVLGDLRCDFAYFQAPAQRPAPGSASQPEPAFRLRLHLGPPPARRIPPVPASLCGPYFVAYDRGLERTVDYHGEALSVFDFDSESGEVYAGDRALLREMGYLLVLSRAGVLLDRKGLHRVHALGVSLNGRGTIVLLPSGGGKTALCLALLRARKAALLSEDTPLIGRDGTLWPFPLRLSAHPREDLSDVPEDIKRTMLRRRYGEKILVGLDYFQGMISGPARPYAVVVACRSGRHQAEGAPAWRAAGLGALFSSLVVGLGTPQLREYVLRWDAAGLAGLAAAAASRAAAMACLLARSRVARLCLGTDRTSNAEALVRLVASL